MSKEHVNVFKEFVILFLLEILDDLKITTCDVLILQVALSQVSLRICIMLENRSKALTQCNQYIRKQLVYNSF